MSSLSSLSIDEVDENNDHSRENQRNQLIQQRHHSPESSSKTRSLSSSASLLPIFSSKSSTPNKNRRHHDRDTNHRMLLYLRRYPLYVFIVIQILLLLFYLNSDRLQCKNKPSNDKQYQWLTSEKLFVSDEEGRKMVPYDKQLPIIFIGGMPRSGTTLLRVLLDAHPSIRCGEETRVIPRILSYRQTWLKSAFEAERLEQAGISKSVLDSAISSFILEIIVKHGKPAPRLCNKDPFTIRSAVYLQGLFPKAKFIFMVRDGRAVVHSIISRKVTISGFDLTSYRQCMKKWNSAMEAMYKQCKELGPSMCLPVIYEQLVLHPKKSMEKILDFLDVPWSDSVLHHEQIIETGHISLSKLERSTDQVIKPINLEALSKWVGQIPEDVTRDMKQLAPMLNVFGYDLNSDRANYGTPDQDVLDKMQNLHKWEDKEKEAILTRERLREEILKNNDHHSEHSESNDIGH